MTLTIKNFSLIMRRRLPTLGSFTGWWIATIQSFSRYLENPCCIVYDIIVLPVLLYLPIMYLFSPLNIFSIRVLSSFSLPCEFTIQPSLL